MAKMHKIEEKIELNCPAEKIFEMLGGKQPDIPELCSDKVPSIKVHQGDWVSVGSTRKWDLNMGEKSTYVVDRIDEIDEENMVIIRSVIDGEMMSHYKSLKSHVQAIPKGNDNKSCIVVASYEYEKIEEDAPNEPKELLSFGLSVLKDLSHHLASA